MNPSHVAEASRRVAARRLLPSHLGHPSRTIPPVHVASSHRHGSMPRENRCLPLGAVESSNRHSEISRRNAGMFSRASRGLPTRPTRSFPPASTYRRDHEASRRPFPSSRPHAWISDCDSAISLRPFSISRWDSWIPCRRGAVSRRVGAVSFRVDARFRAHAPARGVAPSWSLERWKNTSPGLGKRRPRCRGRVKGREGYLTRKLTICEYGRGVFFTRALNRKEYTWPGVRPVTVVCAT